MLAAGGESRVVETRRLLCRSGDWRIIINIISATNKTMASCCWNKTLAGLCQLTKRKQPGKSHSEAASHPGRSKASFFFFFFKGLTLMAFEGTRRAPVETSGQLPFDWTKEIEATPWPHWPSYLPALGSSQCTGSMESQLTFKLTDGQNPFTEWPSTPPTTVVFCGSLGTLTVSTTCSLWPLGALRLSAKSMEIKRVF